MKQPFHFWRTLWLNSCLSKPRKKKRCHVVPSTQRRKPIKQPSEFHDVPIAIGLFSWPQWLWLAYSIRYETTSPMLQENRPPGLDTTISPNERFASAWNQFYYQPLPHDPHVCQWILLISIDGVYIIYAIMIHHVDINLYIYTILYHSIDTIYMHVDAIWYPL